MLQSFPEIVLLSLQENKNGPHLRCFRLNKSSNKGVQRDDEAELQIWDKKVIDFPSMFPRLMGTLRELCAC